METTLQNGAAQKFAAFFNADLPVTRIPVALENGKEGWLDLKPLNDAESAEFENVGVVETSPGVFDVDGAKRVRWLVSRTLVDFSLWKKNGEEWQQFVSPQTTRQERCAFIELNFDLTAAFGKWLFEKCLEVNGLIQATAGEALPSPNS